MGRNNSGKSNKPSKPAKPRADYPLWWRSDPRCDAGGYWCKTIDGEKVGFGSDAEQAEELLKEHLKAIEAGRDPQLTPGRVTVHDVYSEYVDHLHGRAQDGEIKPREFNDRRRFLDHFCAHIGKTELVGRLCPGDFAEYLKKLRRDFGIEQRNKRIREIRKMFDFASDGDMIEHPLKFGPRFKPVGGKAMKKVRRRAKKKKKPYTLRQIRKLLCRAPQPLKAMAWLGINCSLGPTDLGLLPLDKIHLKIERDNLGHVVKASGYHDFPRPKNDAVERVCFFFPETVLALEQWIAQRPEPSDPAHADRVFLTMFGNPFVRDNVIRETSAEGDSRIVGNVAIDALNPEWKKLCDALKIPAGFYRLKHTGSTWMSNLANDDHAECRIRGHYLPGMSRRYVHKIESIRVRRIVKKLWRKVRRRPKVKPAEDPKPVAEQTAEAA